METMELGKRQELTVIEEKEFGFYLGRDAAETVLLPRGEAPEGLKEGDTLTVFLYLDSEDRPIATTLDPGIELGRAACLPVSQCNKIGAFLDWGLRKELFLPFHEQVGALRPGQRVPVLLYLDKSGRLAATMKIYKHLQTAKGYAKNDKVSGLVYEVKPELGAFVAVDGRYFGMIPEQELYEPLEPGETVEARVLKVRRDGKLDLSARKKAYRQMDADAEKLLAVLDSYDGVLPFSEKAEPEVIKAELGLSKNAFKRAAGRLLKEGKISIEGDRIVKR